MSKNQLVDTAGMAATSLRRYGIFKTMPLMLSLAPPCNAPDEKRLTSSVAAFPSKSHAPAPSSLARRNIL